MKKKKKRRRRIKLVKHETRRDLSEADEKSKGGLLGLSAAAQTVETANRHFVQNSTVCRSLFLSHVGACDTKRERNDRVYKIQWNENDFMLLTKGRESVSAASEWPSSHTH